MKTASVSTHKATALSVELTNRVDALNVRWGRLQAVIEERAADPTMQAPGSSTGLLTRTQKQIGSGDSAVTVEEYQVDTRLLKELREHEKRGAQELGQWSEKSAFRVQTN